MRTNDDGDVDAVSHGQTLRSANAVEAAGANAPTDAGTGDVGLAGDAHSGGGLATDEGRGDATTTAAHDAKKLGGGVGHCRCAAAAAGANAFLECRICSLSLGVRG